jgi:hypothetical protein
VCFHHHIDLTEKEGKVDYTEDAGEAGENFLRSGVQQNAAEDDFLLNPQHFHLQQALSFLLLARFFNSINRLQYRVLIPCK